MHACRAQKLSMPAFSLRTDATGRSAACAGTGNFTRQAAEVGAAVGSHACEQHAGMRAHQLAAQARYQLLAALQLLRAELRLP
jgi:hypothetical protein